MRGRSKSLHCLRTLALLGLAAVALPASAIAQEKVLKWAYQADIQDLDPYGTTSAASSMLINVYESLVRRNAKMELEPALATSWELVEPNRWRFHLREGVKFHNGNDFNADDVIFSYQRVSHENSWIRDRVAMVDHIEKVDDFTLDFVTKQPNPIVPNIWTGWLIMDKEWSEANGAEFPTNLVENKISYAATSENGTGPFRVTYRENGVRTEFEPFKEWWGEKKHNLDKVVFTPITQDGTRVAALLSGEIDMMYPVPVQDIKRVESTGTKMVLTQPELRTIYFGFDQFRDKALETDTETNPYKDVRVRKAIYQAIDVEGIKTRIMDGMSEPAHSLISPILFPKVAEIERYPYDPEASKALLAEAGYPNGFSTKIDCYSGRYVNDDLICQALVTMLARVGIKAKLYLNPPTSMGKVIGRPNQTFAIYQLGWTPAGLDSYNILYNLMSTWNPETGAGRINNGDFSNPRIDEITKLVESETDKDKRDALILEAYKIVHDNVYYVPLHHQNVTWAVRQGVEIEQRPDDQFDFRTVRMD